MLIVLEGPDCAGKSTIAEQLVTQLAVRDPGSTIELLHRGPPKDHPLDEYVAPLLDYRPGTGRHIICDRWHLGELVYPLILGRPTQLDHEVFSYIELFLESRGALTIVLLPDPIKCLIPRLEARGDDVATHATVLHAWSAFTNLNVNAQRFITPPTIDEIIARAMGAAIYATCRHFTTHVGSHAPNVLLLGDVRGPGHTTLSTAFMPYPATSGHFLFKALQSLVMHTPDIALANACDVDDVVDLWETLGEPAVVALGANAHRELINTPITYATAPHPQYVRRFHHSACHDYGRLIWDIIGTERNERHWRPSQEPPVSEYMAT